MKDNHIHIGQFHENYYNPVEIIHIVMEKCTEGLCFSSTTTCKENVTYLEIENEISYALSKIPWSAEIVRPFLWYSPTFLKQGVNFEKIVKELPYKGIKLHPLAQQWDLSNKKVVKLLHEIFEYARHYNLPILIHTGNNIVDAANIFSDFFPLYHEVKFILAHCRPLTETISLISTYSNVYGDTAFLPEEDLQKIILNDLSYKMILGSDFPISNYFKNKYSSENNREVTLQEQYNIDYNILFHFSNYLNCIK